MSDFTALERYEAKYHISAQMIPIIQDALRSRCTLDPACTNGPYKISSLYVDGPRLPLYQATKLKLARRFKLRVRAYQNRATFFEVKRRIKSIVYKSRVAVPYKTWPKLIQDPLALSEYSQSLSDEHTAILYEFVHRYIKTHAQAQTIVEYSRQAYEGIDDSYVRITIDSNIKACYMPDHRVYFSDPSIYKKYEVQSELNTPTSHQAYIASHLNMRYQPWYPLDLAHRFNQFKADAVLEIKTENSFPLWISDLIQRLNITWKGFSKYGGAIETLHPHLSNLHASQLSQLTPHSLHYND
jgi:SPX domain protein involved in polyphosphate accumulation